MYDHGKGVFVQHFENNLAGWTEGQPQFCDYPWDGTFDEAHLLMAALCTRDTWGDPRWDYVYMKQALRAWENRKFNEMQNILPRKRANQWTSQKPRKYMSIGHVLNPTTPHFSVATLFITKYCSRGSLHILSFCSGYGTCCSHLYLSSL